MWFAHKLVQDCLRYTCAKYYPSVLIFDKVITKIKRFQFFMVHSVYQFVHLFTAQCAGVFCFYYIQVIQLRGADCASWVSPTIATGCWYAAENIRTVPFGRLCISTVQKFMMLMCVWQHLPSSWQEDHWSDNVNTPSVGPGGRSTVLWLLYFYELLVFI